MKFDFFTLRNRFFKCFRNGGLGNCRALTLIEVLVVIAIIGILTALLLPTFSRGKESAQSAICMNNLHQIGIATYTYTLDWNSRLPWFRT
jgi:prepilin-type N-terminal cleavage/methylation domain-containing protein